MAWLVESFPSHVRLTSVAIGYNFAMAVFGGSSAAVATTLTDRYGNNAPGFLISVVAVLAMFGLFLQPRQQMERSCRAHEVLADLELETGGSSSPKKGRAVMFGDKYDDEMEMI